MPGPGMYDTSSKFPGNPAYSISGKHEDKINPYPGPGHYDADPSKVKTG